MYKLWLHVFILSDLLNITRANSINVGNLHQIYIYVYLYIHVQVYDICICTVNVCVVCVWMLKEYQPLHECVGIKCTYM